MESAIALQHLVKKFGDQTVLQDVNLIVNTGEIVGLIGPSGAGKSTVIKTTLGMEVTDGGTATVFGKTMPNRELLSRIGYMAQSDALYDSLSAFENLKFYAQMKGIPNNQLMDAIDHVADVVELTNDLNKRVNGFSGGMQRRLSLAIALLGQPELLILDEPTVGIDPALRLKIWSELNNLKLEGKAILITTHVMDEAEKVDKVALLLGGKVIAFDDPTSLKADYQVNSVEEAFLKAEAQQS